MVHRHVLSKVRGERFTLRKFFLWRCQLVLLNVVGDLGRMDRLESIEFVSTRGNLLLCVGDVSRERVLTTPLIILTFSSVE